MSSLKNLALPGVALVGLIAYWIWRSSAPTTEAPAAVPPDKAAPSTKQAPREPGAGGGATAKRDGPSPTRRSSPEAEPPRITERDRAKTDALRLALRERHTSRGGSRGGADEAEDDEPALGTLDKDYIRARIQEDLVPIAKECYESALEDEPKLGGKLIMKFAIVGDEEVGGVVEEADADPTSDIKNVELLECMKESMLALSFPPPEGGGRVQVTYPFEFASDAPAPAAK